MRVEISLRTLGVVIGLCAISSILCDEKEVGQLNALVLVDAYCRTYLETHFGRHMWEMRLFRHSLLEDRVVITMRAFRHSSLGLLPRLIPNVPLLATPPDPLRVLSSLIAPVLSSTRSSKLDGLILAFPCPWEGVLFSGRDSFLRTPSSCITGGVALLEVWAMEGVGFEGGLPAVNDLRRDLKRGDPILFITANFDLFFFKGSVPNTNSASIEPARRLVPSFCSSPLFRLADDDGRMRSRLFGRSLDFTLLFVRLKRMRFFLSRADSDSFLFPESPFILVPFPILSSWLEASFLDWGRGDWSREWEDNSSRDAIPFWGLADPICARISLKMATVSSLERCSMSGEESAERWWGRRSCWAKWSDRTADSATSNSSSSLCRG